MDKIARTEEADMARLSKRAGKRSARKARDPKGRKRSGAKRTAGLNRSTSSDLELKAAREQQAASADILKLIASSPNDVQPVFEAIVTRAAKLFEPCSATITILEGNELHWGASAASISGFDVESVRTIYPVPFDRVLSPSTRAILERRIIEIPDTDHSDTPAMTRRAAATGGFRSITFVPLIDRENGIGTIIFNHPEAGFRYSERQLNFIRTFADQAVIAIQNARLFNQVQQTTRDLSEALAQQTATSDVLRVISSSSGDLRPVFRAMLENALKICEASYGNMMLATNGGLELAEPYNSPRAFVDLFKNGPLIPPPATALGRVLTTKKAAHIPDLLAEGPSVQQPALRTVTLTDMRARTLLAVPMLKDKDLVGVIVIYRQEMRPFSEKQIELVSHFADQAVIAIENTRLFNGIKDALERQRATTEVLTAISGSMADAKPVFEVIVQSCERLFESSSVGLMTVRDGQLDVGAYGGQRSELIQAMYPAALSRNSASGMAILERRTIILEDINAPGVPPMARAGCHALGMGSAIFAPLLADGRSVGSLFVGRPSAGAFAPERIALVEAFASQAVIAIENARLFNETREALERQTATGDVLKIISRSSVELEKVLDTLVQAVARLCRADQVYMFHLRHNLWHMIADYGLSVEARAFFQTNPFTPGRGSTSGRAAIEGRAVSITDVLQDPEYTLAEGQAIAGYRSTLGVPLFRENTLIGVFSIVRARVDPFTSKEIELASTFADQAVIAIENARLFEELRERQAELRVTFDNMGDGVAMFGGDKRLASWNRNWQKMLDLADSFLMSRPSFAELFRYLAARGEFDSADVEAELSRTLDDPGREMRYERTRPDGRVIEVRRNPVPDGGFVLIYADITERKRAEETIRIARDAAEKALRDLQAAQDRLVQTEKLASLGQLTAGIAHEIKNPLNFVNNFAALSAELIDEMSELFENAALDERDKREGLDEIRKLLRGNLEKVVQHGKRADSIVKNMLLHSREGSGERRSTEINRLVEESLNLAYHGARAEKPGFSITLKHDLDPEVGALEVYPQEMTRALLNLISNGFYAATRRKAETDGDFEPVLSAVTKKLGDTIEIRIRDNGTGIPPEVRERMFNPFFTTKPTGEGTGLGLSMTYDIIVKQHGGKIDFETEQSAFTEFIVSLPCGNNITS